MPRKTRASWLLLLCGAVFFCFCAPEPAGRENSLDLGKINPEQLPHSLSANFLMTAQHVTVPVDLNNDGRDELLVLNRGDEQSPQQIIVSTPDLENIFVTSQYGYIDLCNYAFDINDDGYKEVFFSKRVADSCFLCYADVLKNTVHQSKVAERRADISRKWDGWCKVFACTDVNGDGIGDLLLTVITEFAYQPRSIIAWDVAADTLIWETLMGACLGASFLYDVDSDGYREIVTGGRAPDNGQDALEGRPWKVNGTDDKQPYLMVLDSLGNIRTALPVGKMGDSIECIPWDWQADGTPDLLVYVHGSRIRGDYFFSPWQASTGKLVPKHDKVQGYPSRVVSDDVDYDGVTDLLVFWSHGLLEAYDANLKAFQSLELPGFDVNLMDVHDLNGDGQHEIVVYGTYMGQARLLVFDRHFKLQAMRSEDFLMSGDYVSLAHNRPAQLMIRNQDSLYLLKYQNQYFHFIPGNLSWQGLVGSWLFFAVLLLSVLALTHYRRHRHTLIKTLHMLFYRQDTGFMLLDHHYRIQAVNQPFSWWLQTAQPHLQGQDAAALFMQSPLKSVWDAIAASISHQTELGETDLHFQHDKQSRHLLISCHPINMVWYRRPLYLIFAQEVTSLIQSKRAVAWASMAQKLAHEIKTPLSTVMLSAQQVQNYCEEHNIDGSMTKYTGHITQQVERLHSLTDSFLKFAHIQQPQFSSFDLAAVCHEIMDDAKFQMGGTSRLSMALHAEHIMLKADRQQVKIAIENCVHNALKATREQGLVMLRSTALESLTDRGLTSSAVQIEIADTGSGIPENQINQLFEPFFSKTAGGTGMGLVIVKKIIEDHEGSIRVTSREGIGTSVFIALPVRATED